jgi:stage II sporulation protein D
LGVVLAVCAAALAAMVLMPGCAQAESSPTRPTARTDGAPGERSTVSVAGAFTQGPVGPPVSAITAITGEPDIRVRVIKGAQSVRIGGARSVVVRVAGASVGKPELLATPITITSGPEGVVVASGSGAGATRRALGFGQDVEVMPSDGLADGDLAPASQALTIDKVRYPGFVTIRPQWSASPGAFDVVCTMGVEAYVPGVLTHELFKDWPRQTYETQAIAARSYALHERWRARGEGRAFDVEDTDTDQVYGGMSTSTLANEAARATKGLVLTDRGVVLRAYYSSTCGSRPASAAFAWPDRPDTRFNKAPPLQGQAREHACQRATFYRWSVKRSDDDVARRMRAWGRMHQHAIAGVSRPREIVPASRNNAERPNTYTITDDRGATFTLTAEELRASCNYAIPDAAPITRDNRLHSGDVIVQVWANEIAFSGRGWGHGVGMCQWCARGFADLGWDWRRMMDAFYPGAVIEKLY